MTTVWDDLAQKIRGVAAQHARNESHPTLRFSVKAASPLTLEQIDGDLVLYEGDPDLTLAHTLDQADPPVEVGDMVLVHETGPSDNREWYATAVVKRGNSG